MYNFTQAIGKVCIRRKELYKYHGKEHWFPLSHVDADSEVQVNIKVVQGWVGLLLGIAIY